MSLRTLPIIFFNMGGEMLYILEQRLVAQNVRKEKSVKVLNDIISAMFSPKFMEELFKLSELYSKKAVRLLFDKLAHASIMRLNQNSMDKLYDLMTMAVKYQMQATASPREVLYITMNHFDGIRRMIDLSSDAQQTIDNAHKKFTETYGSMNLADLYLMRQTILMFFQDCRVKISILLREKKQNADGRFVISLRDILAYGAQPPGSIRYFSKGKPVRTIQFQPGAEYTEQKTDGTLQKIVEKPTERGTILGTNMYKDKSALPETQGGTGGSSGLNSSNTSNEAKSQESFAKEELDLLRLLVGTSSGNDKSNFTLNLFGDADFDEPATTGPKPNRSRRNMDSNEPNVIKIDASKGRRRGASIERSMNELKVRENSKSRKTKGEEMLDLMDAAENSK